MRNPHKQHLILITAALLMAAGIGVFRVGPLLRQRQALAETIRQHQQTLKEIHTSGAGLDELAGRLEHLQPQAAVFEARIPPDRSFGTLWQRLADLMNQYHLSDQRIQPGPAVESDRLGAIPLTLAAVGSMRGVFAFFQAVEQWDRLIRFEQVELLNNGPFDGSVKLNAKAVLYYQVEAERD